MIKIAKFTYSALLVVITAWLCSYFTQFGINGWYNALIKPFGTPPNQIFAPVWSLIYALMIMSFYQVLNVATPLRPKARQLFIAQLIIQIIWCLMFFYEGMLGAAFGVILLLDFTAWKMVKTFYQIRPLSAYLNYPYLLWLCFATFLNFTFMYTQGAIIEF